MAFFALGAAGDGERALAAGAAFFLAGDFFGGAAAFTAWARLMLAFASVVANCGAAAISSGSYTDGAVDARRDLRTPDISAGCTSTGGGTRGAKANTPADSEIKRVY